VSEWQKPILVSTLKKSRNIGGESPNVNGTTSAGKCSHEKEKNPIKLLLLGGKQMVAQNRRLLPVDQSLRTNTAANKHTKTKEQTKLKATKAAGRTKKSLFGWRRKNIRRAKKGEKKFVKTRNLTETIGLFQVNGVR